MNGWIKLHCKTLENDVFLRDPMAWRIFEYLLLRAYMNRPQGRVVTSSYKIGNALYVTRSTVYKAVARLKNAKMVTTSVTGRATTYYICNWDNYQQEGSYSSTRSVATEYPLGSALNKNKIKNKENISRVSDETATRINELYELYLTEFETTAERFKFTPARKVKLRARVKDAGFDLVAQAIRNTAASAFHRGENERGWRANLDFIIRSYEQIEKLAALDSAPTADKDAEELRKKWMTT